MNSFQSTYKAGNANIGLSAEVQRLKVQVMMGWEKEFRNLQWFGLQNGMHILEVGCGPGFATEQLAQRLPDSQITGLDLDEDLLKQAEELMKEKGRENVNFVQASVFDTGLSDNSYDFVVARMLFLHLHNPEEAAFELHRVLKPGGKLTIIDIDAGIFGIIQPDIEGFQSITRKLTEMQSNAGGNRLVGRSLPRLLRKTGFTEIELETVAVHSDLAGVEGFQTQFDPKRFEGFYRNGILTEKEFSHISKVTERLSEDPDSYAMMLFVMACGMKS
ncbi:class I SAM-dependent methyltransferase [Planomicrobium sp. CPCC 101079]|uniref:class I SAM-dependent methyltransferase n=1 Tax=Planomicrobium sp. CPCC 101079 TaxID=2599618 RepID=UPI0011B50CED|nr:methyltransferase domain-containing protein [Planomicrobium sp. CPCC 101079]TWT13188.1 methyltransferase domain-containing protein [Planomicrobium sp. CPCC 101079]